MNATAATLEIACAKPDCHWSGPPGDAAGHDCPTPAPDDVAENKQALADPVAGMSDINGEPIPDEESVAAGMPYRVVWVAADGAKRVTIGTANNEDAALRLAAMTDRGKGSIEIEMYQAIANDADPTDRQEIEAWLFAHGSYDNDGNPADAKTTALADRLSTLLAADPEPDLPEVPDSPVAWQTVIAAELERQPDAKEHRWLVVLVGPDGGSDATLLGSGKTKAEAAIVEEDAQARPDVDGVVLIVKTADVLQAAAGLAEAAPAGDESEKNSETAEQTAGNGAPSPHKPSKTLFDASAYDREDLALPKVDGHAIDRIAVAFSGEVMLDRSNPDHVALFRRLTLFKNAELWISGSVKGIGTTGATNREGELDVVVGKRSIKVEHVRILGPEDLDNAAAELAAQARDAAENQEDRDRNTQED